MHALLIVLKLEAAFVYMIFSALLYPFGSAILHGGNEVMSAYEFELIPQ